MKSISRIAVLLVLTMIFGVFTGCNTATPTGTGATTTTTTKSTNVAPTTAASTTTESKFPNLNPPGQLPVVKTKETLRLTTVSSSNILSYAYGENKLTTWLQDRTNVVIEFTFYPEADAVAKFNLEVSTNGDLGDAVRLTTNMTKPALMTFGSQGAILDVTQLLKTYGLKITTDLNNKPGSWEANTAPDGKIYALPQGPAPWLITNSFAMRQWILTDFLNKYTKATGKGMPTTTDEYFNYMVWCRDNDPNGNGKKDEIGWSGAESRNVWYARPTDFLMHAFTWNTSTGYYQRDDVIRANFVEDDYREGLKFLNKMMEAGLMDKDYVSNTTNTLQTTVALNDGKTVASGSWGGMHNAAVSDVIKNSYQIVAPLKGPKGFQNAFYNYYEYPAQPGPVIIPKSSKKPELAMAWFDSCYDIEVSFRQRYGEKGVDWDTPGPGELAVDGGPGIYKDFNDQWGKPTKSHWYTSGPSLYRPYFMATPRPAKDANGNELHDLEKSLYDASVLYEKYVIPCSVPTFYFDVANATKANEWQVGIENVSRNGISEFIFGNRDIDSDKDWENYKAEVEKAGLSAFLKLQQDEYNRAWKGTLPKTYTPFPLRTKVAP